MKNLNSYTFSVLSLLIGFSLSSCGGQAYQPQSANTNSGTSTPTPQASATPTPVPSASPSPTATLPPYSYTFQLTGGTATYTSPSVATDNIYSVTITSGSPTQVGTTGWTAEYTCLQFNVAVGSESQQVTLSYGNPTVGPCAGKSNSQTIDFSNQATPGHGNLAVTITQGNYDNCYKSMFGGYGVTPGYSGWVQFYPGWGKYYGGCTMTSALSTDTLTGTLAVHVNGTQ